MQFMGKFTFQSTNTEGPRKYLTLATSEGMTVPTVAAEADGENERWLLYEPSGQPPGGTDAELIMQTDTLYYLGAVEHLGFVIADQRLENSYRFKFTNPGALGGISLQIWLPDKERWAPIHYIVNNLFSYLTFPIPQGIDRADPVPLLTTFTRTQITPSLATIQSSKCAQNCDLRNVDLTGADLSGIDFTGADFTGATLDRAKFKGAILTNATFVEASLDGTDMSGVKTLDAAVFIGLNLTKVVWGQGVQARCAHFERCVGCGVRIDSADFSGAHFDGADFTAASLSNACLVNAHMMGGVFVGANFDGAHLNGALLGGTSEAVAANLSYAYMPNVILSGANLFGVSFAFSSLFGAATQADALTAEQADFSNAYLEGVHFTSAPLRGSRFDNACLVSVDFTGADLSPTLAGSVPVSLAGACLHGAIFTGSKLANADFAGATVAFERGHIDTRYCTPQGPFPPPPDCERLNYRKTTGLDLVSLQPTTICPNGNTVEANQKQGICLTQMLTIKHPATAWFPIGCAPARPDDASPR